MTREKQIEEIANILWHIPDNYFWQCSECLRTESTKHKSDIKYYPYCHCGAKMDAKE